MLNITRTELLSLIWSKSTTKLAEEFGVSDVAIAKWCKKMEVPKPPRGYWAKLQAGKAVPQKPKLKRLTKEGVSRITIHRQSTTTQKTNSPSVPRNAVVPGSLDEPHYLVGITRNGLRRGKTDYRKILHSNNKKQLDIQVSRNQVDRACLVFDSLIKTLAKEGIKVSLKGGRKSRATLIEIDGYEIEIGINEKNSQSRERTKTGEVFIWRR